MIWRNKAVKKEKKPMDFRFGYLDTMSTSTSVQFLPSAAQPCCNVHVQIFTGAKTSTDRGKACTVDMTTAWPNASSEDAHTTLESGLYVSIWVDS